MKSVEKCGRKEVLNVDFIDSEDEIFSNQLKTNITKTLENCMTIEKINLPVEVSVRYVSPEEIRTLNRDYRGVDKVTDVLSFPIFENVDEINDLKTKDPINLGDILINPFRAREQAQEIGNSFDREVVYLAIHSFLHLLGYDHQLENEKSKMRIQEKKVLNSIAKDNE